MRLRWSTPLSTHQDLAEALTIYELERRPIVETLQQAAQESRTYFEGIARYRDLPPASSPSIC